MKYLQISLRSQPVASLATSRGYDVEFVTEDEIFKRIVPSHARRNLYVLVATLAELTPPEKDQPLKVVVCEVGNIIVGSVTMHYSSQAP